MFAPRPLRRPRSLGLVAVVAAVVAIACLSGQTDAQDPDEPTVMQLEWLAPQTLTASQLVDLVPGLNLVWRWDGEAWTGYAVADGRPVPGSDNFVVREGDMLHFGERPPPSPGSYDGVILEGGARDGLIADRTVLGDPRAPIRIIDYSDFL